MTKILNSFNRENPISTQKKNSKQIMNIRDFPQTNKEHLWKRSTANITFDVKD